MHVIMEYQYLLQYGIKMERFNTVLEKLWECDGSVRFGSDV